jgi:hypothetical protein
VPTRSQGLDTREWDVLIGEEPHGPLRGSAPQEVERLVVRDLGGVGKDRA